MSQINFTNLFDRLSAAGVQETASVQGHTLKLGEDITVDLAALTRQRVAPPAARADEQHRITHARDTMQSSTKAMMNTLVALGSSEGDRNAKVGTLLSKMWETTVHQQRLNDISNLHPQTTTQAVINNSVPKHRHELLTASVALDQLQQEQMAILLYRLSDADLVNLSKACSSELMDALDECLTDLGKTGDANMDKNVRNMHDTMQKLRVAVMEETSTRLYTYGDQPEGEALQRDLTALHELNEQRFKRGDIFVRDQEKAQCQREVTILLDSLKTYLSKDELGLSARQQKELLGAAQTLYLQDRNSLHAQARQSLMNEGMNAQAPDAVLDRALHIYASKLCTSLGKPSACEKSTGFRASLLSSEVAYTQHSLHTTLQQALSKHEALRPFADTLCKIAQKNPDLLRTMFTAEADSLRALLQGGTEKAAAFTELYGGFAPTTEGDLASAALIRASMSLLRQSWLSIKDMGAKPMQPEVWNSLLNCAATALHVQGMSSNDVARLLPLALQKADAVAEQMRSLAQKSGDEALTGLKDVVAKCLDNLPSLRKDEKDVMAPAMVQLAEAMLTQHLGEALPLQSPNQRLAALAQEVQDSPAVSESMKLVDDARDEYTKAEANAKAAFEELALLTDSVKGCDFGIRLAADMDATQTKMTLNLAHLRLQLIEAQHKGEAATEKRTEVDVQVREFSDTYSSMLGVIRWEALREQFDKPDTKYTTAWMMSVSEQGPRGQLALTKEEREIYHTMAVITNTPPTQQEIDAIHLNSHIRSHLKKLLKTQTEVVVADAAAREDIAKLQGNISRIQKDMRGLSRDKLLQSLRTQGIGHQLEEAREGSRQKLEVAHLTLASKAEKLAAREDVLYGMVWRNPTNFGKFTPTGTPLPDRHAQATARHRAIEQHLAPLRTQVEQATSALETARTAISTNDTAYTQVLNTQQLELANLKVAHSALRQQSENLHTQQASLITSHEGIQNFLRYSEADRKTQVSQLLAESTQALTRKQEELSAVTRQRDHARQGLASMQMALEQGTRDVAGCRQWAQGEVQRHEAQEATAKQLRSNAHLNFEQALGLIADTRQQLKQLCQLHVEAEPIIPPEAMQSTLSTLPKADRPAVAETMQRYNTVVNKWHEVRVVQRALLLECSNAQHSLAAEHSKMAKLRTEQLQLFVAQEPEQPWQGEGPRPANIAESLGTVRKDIQLCTDLIAAYTGTLDSFRTRLAVCERNMAGMVDSMKSAQDALPIHSAARDMAGLGHRLMSRRQDSGKQRHNEIVTQIEHAAHQHQSAYAHAVLRLLAAAEAKGVQDAFLNLLAISETIISPQHLAEAQALLTSLENQQQTLTDTIAQQTTFIAEYNTLLADPHLGISQQAIDLIEQSIANTTQAQENTAAALQKNEADQAQLTEQLLHLMDEREQAVAREVQDLSKATITQFETQRTLDAEADAVAPEEAQWEALDTAYTTYTKLVAEKQPLSDMQRLNAKLNEVSVLHLIGQENLPLDDAGRTEITRLNTALLSKLHPAQALARESTLLLLNDGLPIPRELLHHEMLTAIVDDTTDNMAEAVTAMLRHDATLLPWKDLFERMKAEDGLHPLVNAFRAQANNITCELSGLTAEQWNLSYGEHCSIESLVRLACLRAMRGAVNHIETTAALQSDDLTLLLQGYSLDAIRDIRAKVETKKQGLSFTQLMGLPPLAQRLQAAATELAFAPAVAEQAKQERLAFIPLLCEFYATLRSDTSYAFRTTTDINSQPFQTVHELDGILRFHLQTVTTLRDLSLPEEHRLDDADQANNPNQTVKTMQNMAALVKKYHGLINDNSKLFDLLPPTMTGVLRPMLLETPATVLARFEKLSAQRVAETLNSKAFTAFAGHILYIQQQEGSRLMPQLEILANNIDDLLTIRAALNKELGIHTAPPLPQPTYALENMPQSLRETLGSFTLSTKEEAILSSAAAARLDQVAQPAQPNSTATPRVLCPRLQGAPITNENRLAFLNACRLELPTQQREQNMRATLYGAVLCHMIRATGSEVNGNMVFHALAGHGLSEGRRESILATSHKEAQQQDYRQFIHALMDGDAQPPQPPQTTRPSLEEQVVRAALHLEKGTLTADNASLLHFALPAHAENAEILAFAKSLQQECILFNNMSDPCRNMNIPFDALRTKELLASASLPGTFTVATQVGNFASFRDRVAHNSALPLSDMAEMNDEYGKMYAEVQVRLDEHAKRMLDNAGLPSYLDGLLRANTAQLPRLSTHASVLSGIL